jgi:hypothetical protein
VSIDPGLARRMWHQLEPIHATFYFALEVFAAAARLGYSVDTRWPSELFAAGGCSRMLAG